MEKRMALNRVESELNQWRSKEERFSKLFSFPMSSNRALLKEKLHYYDRIAAMYKQTRDADERFALSVLLQERRGIEKQLYPNPLFRWVRRLLVMPVREQRMIRQDNRKAEQNIRSLHQAVQRAGFRDLSEKIEAQMREGAQQFSIPVSYYLNEKERMEHQLSFIKDVSGHYLFEGYRASLHNEAKPAEKRQQYFNLRSGDAVTVAESYNLLSGRCIQRNGCWLQLDFTDKTAEGDFRMKRFQADYGYNLEMILRQLPLKGVADGREMESLKSALASGNRVSVSFIKEGKEQRYYIEANPQFKSVNLYDEHARKITLHTALGNHTRDALKIAHKVNGQQVKNKGMKIS